MTNYILSVSSIIVVIVQNMFYTLKNNITQSALVQILTLFELEWVYYN